MGWVSGGVNKYMGRALAEETPPTLLETVLMLNRSLKRDALKKHKQVVVQYNLQAERVQEGARGLHMLREVSARDTISACEAYVNTLANTPKEFEKSISEFKIEYGLFTQLLADLQRENVTHEVIGGSVAGAGAAMGVGVAAFAPTAAMAVATTFGVASTGTAISALSGAAATKAALAWLGGGAIAAGGGGMAGGSALLALAGPIGWAIGGAGLLVGGVRMSRGNAQVAEKATKATIEVEAGLSLLRTAETEIERLINLTTEHTEGVNTQLSRLRLKGLTDYRAFGENDKHALGALINNVQSLSKLLNQKVE